MEIDNLAEKVQKAEEAVKSLEEPLKTEAFKKILDKLLETPAPSVAPVGEDSIETTTTSKKKKRKKFRKNPLGKAGLKLKEESEKKKRELAAKLNRSEYSEVYKLKNILPKALFILKIMKEKNVKGLTPPEIQFILREVFSIKEDATAISVTLNRKKAIAYTHRTRIVIGRTVAYVYEIMKAGEDYLEKAFGKKNDREDKTDERKEPDLT